MDKKEEKTRLESLVSFHSDKDREKHEKITRVALVVILILGLSFFLIGIFNTPVKYMMYGNAAKVVVGINEGVDKVGQFHKAVTQSEDITYIKLFFYLSWILLVGLVNVVIFEHHMAKRRKHELNL